MRRESVPLTPVIDSADHRHISYILSKTDKGRNCENSTNFNRSSLKHLVLGQICKVEKDTFFWQNICAHTDNDLVECLLHETDAAAVDWLAVGEEALLQRRGHWGETLQQREQVLVIILKMGNNKNPSSYKPRCVVEWATKSENWPWEHSTSGWGAASAGWCSPACWGGDPRCPPGCR